MAYKQKGFPTHSTSSVLKHRPKTSGMFEEKTGSEKEIDTHQHPHTKEVDETAEYYKKKIKNKTKVRKNDPTYIDIKTRSEIRELNR